MTQMNLLSKQKDSQTQKTDLRVPKEGWMGSLELTEAN